MKFLITGDTHRSETIDRIQQMKQAYPNQGLAIIILGDSGINYCLDEYDEDHKRQLQKLNVLIYLVRGNHEQRPELVPNMARFSDPIVGGQVYTEPEFPEIRYFIDGETYNIHDKSILVLGGAYSGDKNYRLATGRRWFDQEQLSIDERNQIAAQHSGQYFDFILSHTCPYSMRPIDRFLSFIDQSTVDNSMEVWLEEMRYNITYHTWVWGHYHDDRIQEPNHYMLFRRFFDIEDIYNNTTDLKPKEEK
jgi:3-oxoacid CoA-transferase subunit A